MTDKVSTRSAQIAEPWIAILKAEIAASWPRFVRFFILLVMALIQLRFIYTTRAAGLPEEREMVKVCAIAALLGVSWAPCSTVLSGVILAPLISLWLIVSATENPALAYLPFATASLAWTLHGLLFRRQVVLRVTGLGWLCDAFTLTVLVKMGVALLTPSPVNSLWRLLTVPVDFPYSEIQSMNVGFYLLNLVMVFRLLEAESANADRQSKLLAFLLVQFGLVSAAGLAQALFQWPFFFRNGLHSPFIGVHEMGLYMATHFVLFAGFAINQPSLRGRVGWGIAALIAFPLLLGSNSKTSIAVALLALATLGIGRFGRRALVPAAGLTAMCWLIAFLLSRFTLPIDSSTAIMIRNGFSVTANPVNWFDSGKSRVGLYGKALILIEERPLDGVGIGDYRVSHTSRTVQLQRDIPPEQMRDHDAHNLLLNIGAEAGIPSLLLMVTWMGAICLTATNLPNPRLAGWGRASLLAILTGLVANMTNCVLTWPFQGLSFGVLLCLPVAALHAQTPGPAATVKGRRWVWLALLPAALNLGLAPWSVSADMRLQQTSYGFRRWDWFPNERLDISTYPMASIPIAASAQLASVRIRPCEWMHECRPRLTFAANDQILLQDREIPAEGVTLAISPAVSAQTTRLSMATSNPFASMDWPADIGQAWVWHVELWDASGTQIDVRKLPLFSEQVKAIH